MTEIELTRRIVASYERATPGEIATGRTWYGSARAEVRELCEVAPPGIGRVRVAAVVAALSPRAQWAVNLRWARAILEAASYGDPCPAVGLGNGRAKAWAIAQGGDPRAILRGSKVRSFWRNLAGCDQAVTIDVWACRVAGVEQRELSRVGMYERVAASYTRAAELCGESPAALQAITWLEARGAKPADPQVFRPIEPLALEAR